MTDVQNALMVLQSNTDPGTGFEIEIPEPFRVVVMPQNWLNVLTIAKQTEVEVRTGSNTQIRRSSNPLFAINPMKLPMLWYNLLVASGVSTTNAAARWWMGRNDKKAFTYRQIVPFQTQEAPLSSEDVRRDIIMVRYSMEHGVAFTMEPRYNGMFTKEDITP